jgi:DNA polymerase
MAGAKELNRLNGEINSCVKCRLFKTRIKAVPGEGTLGCEFMFLGQGPGREEDQTGRPFVGRAGKLLTGLIESAGLKRKDVFITSAVKCLPTPPLNRKPKPDEIKACFPYLLRQIEIMRPKKIVLLGVVALKLFFPEGSLKLLRGKWIQKDGLDYFISYHPAAGIRFQKFKKILAQDFAALNNEN